MKAALVWVWFVWACQAAVQRAWAEIDVQTPRHFVHTQSFAAIGLGLGEAIGAAIAAEGKPTLLVAGDGNFMLSGLSELTTAVREKLDLVIVRRDELRVASHVDIDADNR